MAIVVSKFNINDVSTLPINIFQFFPPNFYDCLIRYWLNNVKQKEYAFYKDTYIYNDESEISFLNDICEKINQNKVSVLQGTYKEFLQPIINGNIWLDKTLVFNATKIMALLQNLLESNDLPYITRTSSKIARTFISQNLYRFEINKLGETTNIENIISNFDDISTLNKLLSSSGGESKGFRLVRDTIGAPESLHKLGKAVDISIKDNYGHGYTMKKIIIMMKLFYSYSFPYGLLEASSSLVPHLHYGFNNSNEYKIFADIDCIGVKNPIIDNDLINIITQLNTENQFPYNNEFNRIEYVTNQSIIYNANKGFWNASHSAEYYAYLIVFSVLWCKTNQSNNYSLALSTAKSHIRFEGNFLIIN